MCLALPPDTPKVKVGNREVTDALKREWEKLSEEEIFDITEERYQQLIEDKKTKLTGGHNTSITAFHDSVANLEAITDRVSLIHMFFDAGFVVSFCFSSLASMSVQAWRFLLLRFDPTRMIGCGPMS